MFIGFRCLLLPHGCTGYTGYRILGQCLVYSVCRQLLPKKKSSKPASDPLLDSLTIYVMNIHPNVTPASPSLASPLFDASFDSIESLTTTFTSLVVPTLETTTFTEVALGYHRNGQYSITTMTTSSDTVAERYAYTRMVSLRSRAPAELCLRFLRLGIVLPIR